MTQASVVVLGSLHLDVMVAAPGRPRTGETMVGSGWSMRCGGKGGNQALESARHGAATAMVGAVGDDDFGRRLRDNLRHNRVDVNHVATFSAAGSGMSVALVDPTGDYAAVIVSGANLALGPERVADAADTIAGARWLVLQNEVPDAANLAAARVAVSAGCRIILNAAPARPLPPELANMLDILVVNAVEAEMLSEIVVGTLAAARRAAEALLHVVAQVIVTAGAAGLAVASRHAATRAFGPHWVEIVSTHGAGDAFIGALAARLAAGDAVIDAARYANAAAALAVATPVAGRDHLGPEAVASLLTREPIVAS